MSTDIAESNAALRHDLEEELAKQFRCPACGGVMQSRDLGTEPARASCQQCHATYPRIEGVWRLLTSDQEARYATFLGSYAGLRHREGWERDDAYYLALPFVNRRDPVAAIWRIRQRSLERLERVLPPRSGWALDLGAGNGWLSRRLASRGYNTVALDLNVAPPEGLEGGRVYLEHNRVWFGRVQASMDAIPFQAERFNLCTVSAAFHYANANLVLSEVWRVLLPGGMLVITDSPVYSSREAGERMAAEQRARARVLLGREPAALPGGSGFLVSDDLMSAMQETGFDMQMIQVDRVAGRLRRALRRHLDPGRREEAHFPVIVGRKPASDSIR